MTNTKAALRLLLRIAFAVALLALGKTTALAADEQAALRPNIIFIMADDLGYGDLGCYGQQQIQTPAIDRLAAEGRRFLDCYAGSTVCAPSRSVLMTGLHTGHTRVRGNSPRVPLEPDDVTVAEVLKQAGYATGIIGKWGLGEPDTTGIPTRQGFDYWFGYLNQGHAHNYYPEYLWRNTDRVELESNRNDARRQYSHDLFEQEALDFVSRHRNEPFFLYFALTLPHANNERGRDEGNGMEIPDVAPYADRPWPDPQKGHAAMITRLDTTVGRLMERLKSLGLDERTIVFFTSDNGPHDEGGADHTFFNSNGPLRGKKRDLYEGGIRVPMIVRWPGEVEAGTTSGQEWAFWDVLPTLAELAGAEPPPEIDGISMLPAILGPSRAGREQQQHEYLYWEFHERGFKQAVRSGPWKAVRLAQGEPLELYNLDNDLGEQHNIAAEHPDIVARMEEYLAGARSESPYWPPRRQP